MNNNNQIKDLLENSAEDFDDSSVQELKQVWQEAGDADPAAWISVSESQTNEAYQKVRSKINNSDNTESPNTSHSYFRYAVAAGLMLFALGLSYVFTPITVEVPNGETQIVELPDESTIQLNSGSHISYSRLFSWWNREVTLKGEAFFDVTSNTMPFVVTTENAVIKVLGTKFNVRYWPDEDQNRTSVFLTEGLVAFSSVISDDAVTLEPGEQSWVSNIQKSPAEPESADKEKVMAWQKNSIAFENKPLGSVLAELERHFAITVEAQPQVLKEKITIYLSDIDKPEAAIKDICQAKGLTYKQQSNKFVLYRN